SCRRSEQRRCLQVRNSDTFTHARIEIAKNVEKFSLADIDQSRSYHSHYFGVLVVRQKLNPLRSKKQTRCQRFLVAERHMDSGRTSTNLILVDHIIEDQCCSMNYFDSGGSLDRKSTRLNSSHQIISYAVFCLKKKNNKGI